MKKRLGFAMTCLLCWALIGCADLARRVRQYTYPPDFRYIERDQLRSTMWQLAFHWRELNRLLGLAEKQEPERAEIIAHLRSMEQAAEKLGGTGWPSNHPLLDMHLPAFRQNIKFAREAVERESPNYLLAGQVSGACAYCHGPRD
jgi:hypothetical protein